MGYGHNDVRYLKQFIKCDILLDMKPIDITSLIKKYGPGYIAKSRKTGRVIAHAKKLDVLFKKTGKRTDLLISWVPKPGARYVFRISL